jgi:hypothetical protein
VINVTSFKMAYEVEDKGASGVGKAEIWVTRDEGRTWRHRRHHGEALRRCQRRADIQDDSAARSEEVGRCVDCALSIVRGVVTNEDWGVVHRVSFVRVRSKSSDLMPMRASACPPILCARSARRRICLP